MASGGAEYGLQVIGLDTPPPVEHPVITSGRWRAADGEVVLERSYADTLGLSVGDAVMLRGVGGDEPMQVVGIAVAAHESSYPDRRPGEGYLGTADLARLQPSQTTWRWIEAVRLTDPSRTDEFVAQAFEVLPGRTGMETWQGRFADASERTRTTTVVLRTLSTTLLLAVALVLVTLVGARVHRSIGRTRAAQERRVHADAGDGGGRVRGRGDRDRGVDRGGARGGSVDAAARPPVDRSARHGAGADRTVADRGDAW